MGGNLSTEEIGNRHVVIIGGGYAGMELGVFLLKWKIPFTIIDLKEYFHHIVGGLRAVIDPGNNAMIRFFDISGLCSEAPCNLVVNYLCSHMQTRISPDLRRTYPSRLTCEYSPRK